MWNPASVHVARMYRCETADEAAALGTIHQDDGNSRQATVAEVSRTADRLRLEAAAGSAR